MSLLQPGSLPCFLYALHNFGQGTDLAQTGRLGNLSIHGQTPFLSSSLTFLALNAMDIDFFGFAAKFESLIWATFSLSVRLAAASASGPFSRAQIKSADGALWPVEMLISFCSSHVKGLFIWLLMTYIAIALW